MLEIIDRPLRIVAEDSLGSDEGRAARAAGVTASEAHTIAHAGRGAQLRILDDKLNGATFRGNAHTRRGHEREDFLIDWASENVALCAANIALIGHPELTWLLATPDGLGWDMAHGPFGVEVKSHDHTWGGRDDIPAEHYDQMQIGMAVTETNWWLYVWEVMGEDGTPTLDDPRFVWVPRDEHRIGVLIGEAEKFMAWREAGAPEIDDLPADVDDALADWARARAMKTAAAAAEAAADKIIRAYALDEADERGAKGAGQRAAFALTKLPVLDEAAWADAEPASYAEVVDMRTRVKAAEKAAAALYHRDQVRLTITATKGAAS
ncbi:YqaJ-like viral recombinase domain protein [Microbacterium hydrocarbonoxydans]|uniref:YqaJ-like viral recombinase domain protein n=1 Tax=Microbacterium hydrocarbonoxydans TaxID=273678 RepID=A0A0M2HS28_9MICO|nr:YqaJ viral recombinase family protein [Microbacterium hydrocarbonoxydans]KJL49506.1 YqaJ-like viral recombinase domain protein [Microbacterium hydrocarbonoxydans]